MSTLEAQKAPNYFRVALQSALAAAFCLGLPAGLLLWLILFQQPQHFVVFQALIDFLHAHGLYSIYILVVSSIVWSHLLGRISGYRPWWWIAVASALGILAAWFSPLANIDGVLYAYRPALPVHLSYAASMIGLIGGVTLFVGLAYGFILHNIKAALTIGLATSFVSVLALLLTILLFDSLGIRVGTGNLAMLRVTAVALITSGLAGGAMLGVGFRWFVEEVRRHSSQNIETK
jgi:hypothetical protein